MDGLQLARFWSRCFLISNQTEDTPSFPIDRTEDTFSSPTECLVLHLSCSASPNHKGWKLAKIMSTKGFWLVMNVESGKKAAQCKVNIHYFQNSSQ
ncbi:hypothetical protein Csa_009014 [Cucumis sativus]|uniref:Uncharacterized protein n=1 Tax=Cucumis sativus TaxID=3659 RepID=A0A0A0KTK1_CUCSA|nr:hypothetical protein Csa_009014 [Cucumis sativus]